MVDMGAVPLCQVHNRSLARPRSNAMATNDPMLVWMQRVLCWASAFLTVSLAGRVAMDLLEVPPEQDDVLTSLAMILVFAGNLPRPWGTAWTLFATLATAATLLLLPPPTVSTAWFLAMGLSAALLHVVVEEKKAKRASAEALMATSTPVGEGLR